MRFVDANGHLGRYRGSGVEYSMDTFYRMDGCHAATLIGAAVHKEVNDDDYIAVIQ